MKPHGIPHETGLLLALRRVRDGRVIALASELLTDKGRPFPRLLAPFVNELFHHGHAQLGEGGDTVERHVLITDAGQNLLTELERYTTIPSLGGRSTMDTGSANQTADHPLATERPSGTRLVRTFPDSARTDRHHRQALEPSALKPSTPLVWFSINLAHGGMTIAPDEPLLCRHGSVSMEWLRRFPELVSKLSPQRPDVIFLQEALWFNHEGGELLHFLERRLVSESVGQYRGFLTLAHRSPHHQVVFINVNRMIATHHWHGADPDESRRRYGWVQVVVDGDSERLLLLKSVHLDPQDGNDRLAEAIRINGAIDVGQRAIMAGDFNSITSRRTAAEGEPQRDFAAIPREMRFGKGIWPPTKEDGGTDPDTRALDLLLDTGWTCQAIALNNITPTTAPGSNRGGELIIDRCLTHGQIALHSMWVDTSDIAYSDHRALGGVVSIVGDGATAT